MISQLFCLPQESFVLEALAPRHSMRICNSMYKLELYENLPAGYGEWVGIGQFYLSTHDINPEIATIFAR